MDFPDIPDLQTFDERMAYYADIRVERDIKTWILGKGAYDECPENPNGGRPAPTDFTLAKFAAILGEKPGPVREYRNNYAFWKFEFESIPENASWRQCADARRASGWRPGMEVTDLHIKHAVEFLCKKVDLITTFPPDPRPAWRRKLDRACEMLTGIAADPETPALVALAIRTLVMQVTIDKEGG